MRRPLNLGWDFHLGREHEPSTCRLHLSKYISWRLERGRSCQAQLAMPIKRLGWVALRATHSVTPTLYTVQVTVMTPTLYTVHKHSLISGSMLRLYTVHRNLFASCARHGMAHRSKCNAIYARVPDLAQEMWRLSCSCTITCTTVVVRGVTARAGARAYNI